ncbi:hypothetical protein CNMCM7691_007796 [Aspergillus felis]|uniref:ASST-domain-containing protein n=1 Tax=Aspergillus felis TaxID=1287682 RepID=A0A8H6QRX0_9EURO|nr:hypothetical protein CNMCM7691_007796 [Aspergillus felis]
MSASDRISRPTNPDGLVLEAWGQGLMLGCLLVMASVTFVNMKKHILLHKLILIELILAMPNGTFIFPKDPVYGWYQSVTAVGLNVSWSLHNVIAWMKNRPFMSRKVSLFYIGTVILAQPYWVLEIYANFAYFNNYNKIFLTTRPLEPIFRDPWWIFTTCSLFYTIKREYNFGIFELVSVSPRFGIMLASMCLSIAFMIVDTCSVLNVFSHSSLPTGIEPFWKLSFIFKCLCDTVILDDFKTALDRMRAYWFRKRNMGGEILLHTGEHHHQHHRMEGSDRRPTDEDVEALTGNGGDRRKSESLPKERLINFISNEFEHSKQMPSTSAAVRRQKSRPDETLVSIFDSSTTAGICLRVRFIKTLATPLANLPPQDPSTGCSGDHDSVQVADLIQLILLSVVEMPGRGLLRVLSGCTLLSLGAVTVVAQDRWPYMTLQTAPYEPPQIQITKSGTTDPGYLFVGPRGNRPAGTAALIYDEDGNLVYQGPEQVTANFRVQRLFNQDVVTFWAGNMTDLGFGYGSVHILDNTYREIYTVTLQGDFETPDDSVPDSYIDLHESHISARNTLLVTAYNVTQQSLTSIGGTPEDYMLDSLFYEIDIATNEVVHSWSALEHADQIALTDSKQGIDDDHGTHEQPWDAYHINSVELFDQGYLISMRHYWSGYYGEPGKGDFQLDQAGAFSWQHDMRIYNETETSMILSLFNNANTPSETVAPSTGLSYAVDLVNRTAKTLRTLSDSKDVIYSVSQGNYQQLSPSGHVVLGYGSIAKIKEFDANNKEVLTAQFGTDNEVASYRGYKCAWKATPFWAPSIVVRRVSRNSAQVFMSWNGATEYDNWAVMAADSLDSVSTTIVTTFKRTGFETSGTVRGLKTKYLQVVARQGDIPLGTSPIVSF